MKSRIYLPIPIKNEGLSFNEQMDEIYAVLENMRRQVEDVLTDFDGRIQKIESK